MGLGLRKPQALRFEPRLHRFTERLSPRFVTVLGSTVLWALVLLLLTWPVATLYAPSPGVDISFFTGLYLAAHDGLHYGTDIVATYGPLGFLRWPAVYFAWPTRLSIAYVVVLQLLLCGTLLWSLRRTFNVLVAFGIALLVAGTIITIGPHEVSLVIVFVWAVEALRADASPIARRLFPLAAGILAGVEALVKLNTGFTVVLVATIGCLAFDRGRWRSLGVFAAAFLVTASACWFAAGQSLGNVIDFLNAARHMISGWSTVMMLTEPGSGWQRWAAVAVVAVVARCALEATAEQPTRTRIAVCLLWAVVAFSVFKEGFVRQEVGHTSIFFGTALGAALAFTWRRAQATTMLLSIVVLAMAFFGASRGNPIAPVTQAASHVRAIPTTVRVIFDAGERAKIIARNRQSLRAHYAIDPRMLALVGNRTVQVLDSETNAVWAYGLRWQPVPVFEPFLAYDSKLDDLNRDALVSHGSNRIIRDTTPTVDNRNIQFEAPAMERAMFCHYVQLAADRRWQVLGRVPNRCGAPVLLRSVRARWGENVAVPAPRSPRSAVFVRINGAAPTGLERLRTLVYRARERSITLDVFKVYRFVPGTEGDGTLISIPRGADYSPPFALAPNSRTLSIVKAGQIPPSTARLFGRKSPPVLPGGRLLTYAFYEMPVGPARTPR